MTFINSNLRVATIFYTNVQDIDDILAKVIKVSEKSLVDDPMPKCV